MSSAAVHTAQPRGQPIDPELYQHLPRPRRGRWLELDACAVCIDRYWDTLPGRQEPTRAGYAAYATGRPEFASVTRFEMHGGFSAVKQRAREMRRERYDS